MHYTGTIWRPPYEASSLLLEVTAGCTHHKCKFCTLYEDLSFKFRMSPLEDIEDDLKETQENLRRWSNFTVTRTFLTGANPFVLKADRLIAISDLIRKYIPTNETIGCFARITDVTLKTDDELKKLREAGYDGLTIGIETGDDEALQFMNKGYLAADIIEQCRRLDAAGISYFFFYLVSISGAGRGEIGAKLTAEVCNQIHPKLIGANMLTIYPESELYQEIQRGTWAEESEIEKYREIRVLVDSLTIPTAFAAMGASNAYQFYGKLPRDKEKLLATLVDMISGMEVKEDDEDFLNAVDYMFKGLEQRKPDCFAVKQYKKYKLSSGKTAKSILISCGARLAPFDIPQLREIMSYDELELDRMGDRRTATFFCISDTDSTYNFLVALAFSQMFNLLCERADNVHGGRLPHHVRVLWDEAANTGQVPNLEKLVAVIRSREVSLTLFYQQLAQCKAIYDKNAETILGNMDSVIFLGGREASTIKEISENWLGKATISMQTDGRTRGNSESYSQNNQRVGRELMTPSELATMPGDRCILQLRGLPPFYSKKYDLKQHPNYKYTAEADKKKNAFSLDRLINRRRRPGLNEECEVYEATVPDEALTDEDEDILNYDDLDDPDDFV